MTTYLHVKDTESADLTFLTNSVLIQELFQTLMSGIVKLSFTKPEEEKMT